VIRTVVFDVGETLVDETRAWTEHAHAAGVTPFTLFGALGALIERGEHHNRVWQLLGVPRPSGAASITPADLYPDAAPTLSRLRDDGYAIGLAGNQPEGAEQMLADLGLPVAFIASSASWGVEKPSPVFFARVVESAGVPAAEIAYVGDRLDNDVLPAREAGMAAVFIRRGPWGHIHAHRVDAARAHAQIDGLAELTEVLAGIDAVGTSEP
jgi:HAD superfamily hydrolase (TIGR01509 family)